MDDITPQLTEEDSVDCHLQRVELGGLVCLAARQTGSSGSTNEVTPEICLKCEAGRVYREVGCDHISPKLTVHYGVARVAQLFCSLRKRATTLEYCSTCGLAAADTTRELVSGTRGLFDKGRYYESWQALENARRALRDSDLGRCITQAVVAFESTMREVHERRGAELPTKKDVTGWWKSTRSVIRGDEGDADGYQMRVMNSLCGLVSSLGGLRNARGDAHATDIGASEPTPLMAELALNASATLSTAVIRMAASAGGDTRVVPTDQGESAAG